MRLSRLIPRRFGHRAIRIVTFFVARRDSQLTRTIRANMRVVLDTEPGDPKIDRLVHDILHLSASGTYDFFRALASPIEENRRLIDMPQALWDALDPTSRPGRGLLVVGPHVGVLDLAGIGFAASPFVDAYDIQVLSYALPPSGYEVVNDLRATEGLTLTPSSGDALREAAERLRNGGIVFTGLDRPPPRNKKAQTATFFDKPARLWDGFARLAVTNDALLLIIWVERVTEGRYRLNIVRQLDPIELDGNDPVATLWRATLDETETIIAAHPDQWLMFFPVWPDDPT
jgi:lauroyl/myristoyl acyltransferase